MLRKRVPRPIVRGIQRVLFPVPSHLARNQIQISPEQLKRVRDSIETNYYQGFRDKSYYPPKMYERTLLNKLHVRLDSDRRLIVPWLNQARPLKGSHILEVGCGTGCSTVALAEQGATVVGIDVDEYALAVARDRMEIYGLPSEFHRMNADEMTKRFEAGRFNFIIFFAALEHMSVAERMAALRDTWQLLPVGGLLVVVETPNRLWFYDGHTAMLPFYHWLPDELAFQYARFSPRENFRERFTDYNDAELREQFVRAGRGMSFHEFDLAIKPARSLHVVSSLSTFQGLRYKPQRSLFERRYKRVLKRIYPGIHEGFYEDTLYLIVRKD